MGDREWGDWDESAVEERGWVVQDVDDNPIELAKFRLVILFD